MNRNTIEKIKTALRFSTAEGVAYGTFLGFGDHYLVAYAVALQTNNLQIGILCSVPGFLASLAQLWDVQLVHLFKSRKAVIFTFALLQGLMLLPIMAITFLSMSNPGWWLILFATLYSVFGALTTPAWGSLMAEVVPDSLRGKYFARRGALSTLATIISFMAGGIFLNILIQKSLWGFAALFGAALLARLISWVLLSRLYEVPSKGKTQGQFKAGSFTRDLVSTNLGRYLIFLFAMSFVVNIASPYFTVYLLRDLKFNYIYFAGLDTISSIATVIAITHWGKGADRAGNRRMILLASSLIPLVPLLWLMSTNLVYLGFIQVFSGFAWAGFNLCTVNYLYDATTPENRTRYLAFFNAGNGIAAGLGALLGGYLVSVMPPVRGNQILGLFLVSGVLRGIVALVFLHGLKEVRKVSQLPAAELFHVMMGGRPVNRAISHRRTSHFHFHESPPEKTETPDKTQ